MKTWRYDELLKFARTLVQPASLVLRSTVIKNISDDESMDEQYWSNGLSLDLSQFKIVSIANSIWVPLQKARPNLKVQFVVPQCDDVGMSCNVMSYCKEYENSAQVVIHNKQRRLCVRRFLEAKELLHLLTETVVGGEQQNMVADAWLEQSLDGRNFVADFDHPLSPEAVGFYLAIEVLLPWCLRRELNMMLDQKATTLQIAKAFMVPEFVIRHVQNVKFGNRSYLGVSYEWNSKF